MADNSSKLVIDDITFTISPGTYTKESLQEKIEDFQAAAKVAKAWILLHDQGMNLDFEVDRDLIDTTTYMDTERKFQAGLASCRINDVYVIKEVYEAVNQILQARHVAKNSTVDDESCYDDDYWYNYIEEY